MNMNNQDKLEEKKLTELELLQFIEQEYGQKIRYNLLTEEIELDDLENWFRFNVQSASRETRN